MTKHNPYGITHSQASEAILKAVRERTLIQGDWHRKGADGREQACLLGSIHSSVKSPSDCNGDLMPLWLAELVPTLFDKMPGKNIFDIGERFGKLVNRWHVLDTQDWELVLNKFLFRVVDDALESARPKGVIPNYWAAVESACEQTKTALIENDKEKLKAASAAANAAARAAARAAAYAAANTARAAAYAAANTARAAANAADAARAAERLFAFLLDIIEKHVTAREPSNT